MANIPQKEHEPIQRKLKRVPENHDMDWEYSGEFYVCLECGHEFRKPPYDFEVCPECGADFWQDQE